jgi:hypothetical protein
MNVNISGVYRWQLVHRANLHDCATFLCSIYSLCPGDFLQHPDCAIVFRRCGKELDHREFGDHMQRSVSGLQ